MLYDKRVYFVQTVVNKHTCNAIRLVMKSRACFTIELACNLIALQHVLHCNYVCTPGKYFGKVIYVRGCLQRTSAKISDFQTTLPLPVRVCPNFQNPPPGRPDFPIIIFTRYFFQL